MATSLHSHVAARLHLLRLLGRRRKERHDDLQQVLEHADYWQRHVQKVGSSARAMDDLAAVATDGLKRIALAAHALPKVEPVDGERIQQVDAELVECDTALDVTVGHKVARDTSCEVGDRRSDDGCKWALRICVRLLEEVEARRHVIEDAKRVDDCEHDRA